ncbi:Hypothetical protein [Arabidopsis thaliana]|uniref:F15H11.19 protein n=1 Tax=Arabidopsis thaliana TaxID=3702 RepID=Q9SSJ9_ARATH|nr:Hypothetical protein [Arabidopsis thaliana]
MEGGIRQTYYEILGVAVDSSAEQIRRAYHKLAKIWHPDRWTKDPFRSGEAKRRFQQIQEAYSVLSDERKRSSYDVGLYDSGEDEEKQYSLEELQTMVDDMVYEFQSEPLFQNQSMQMNFDLNQTPDWHSQMSLPLSSFEFYSQSSY